MALDLSFPPSLAPTPALSVTSDPLDRKRSYTVGTRKSALALIQTQLIATHLKKTHSNLEFPVHSSSTLGDRNQTTPLHLLSPYTSSQPAKSLWTDELELLLAAGQFDMIVHSLKDVPTTLKEGFELGCCFKREDPRDAVVMREGSKYKGLGELPAGSVVGTGSVRRVAQLKRAYPNLRFEDMRGNLNTRLSKLDSPTSHFSALILAIAGMTRLGQAHRITAPLPSPVLMHAVGQGALGVEIRHGDRDTRQLLRQIGHWETEWRCAAERGLLRVLEGGCSVPVGVETTLVELKPKLRTQPSSSGGPSGVNGHDESAAHGHNAGYAESSFEPLNGDSPILHLSGLLPLTQPLPPASMSADELAQYLAPRKAVLKLSASVTSLDGTTHVVYDAPEQVVSSWRSAQAWGEECARKLKEMGAGEVLDVINEQRRAREAEDVERARKVREEGERKRRENGEERIEGYSEGNVPASTAATA